MTTTMLKMPPDANGRDATLRALRAAGLEVIEVRDWDEVREPLARCPKAIVVCDEAPDEGRVERIASVLAENASSTAAIPRDAMRKLSHDLRTPLSAMAGWLHLIESGKLDEEGLKRAIAKLRGNIEDQVRTVDRYLAAATTHEGHR